jgi:NAD(P)-dependent dehydrogenase (short-subunit alcohol dehydrogenase family)
MIKQLIAFPSSQVSTVFAAIRTDPPAPLQNLIDSSNGRVVPIKVQITQRSSIDEAVKVVEQKLGGKGLDVLINNAGILPLTMGPIESMPEKTLREAFDVNVVAVHNVIAAFLPLLKKGTEKKIVTV